MSTQPQSPEKQDSKAAPPAESVGPGTPAAAARRRHERHPVQIVVDVFELGEGNMPAREWQCRTLDLSRGGLGMVSDRMVHRGRMLLIIVPDSEGKGKKLLCGTVCSATYRSGKGYILGVEFTQIPDSPELWAWRSERGLVPPAGKDPKAA